MAKYAWPAGSTSKTLLVFIQDSASTTGAGKTGLTVGAINAQQLRVLTTNAVERVTLSATNLASIDSAFLSGGFIQIDATNCPGWYRLDVPNAALSIGAVAAGISIIGSVSASNVAQLALEIQLQNTPVDVITWNGASVSASYLMPTVVRMWDATSVSSSNLAVTDFSTRVNANVQAWAGKSVSTSDLAAFSVSQTVLTSAAGGSVNVGQWAGVTVSASNIAIKNTLAKTTHITGLNDISKGTVSSVVMGTAMTESYAVDGAAFTLPQAMYQIWARLSEFSISAQVITALQLDGTTPAMTFSLDSATAPTKVNRVS